MMLLFLVYRFPVQQSCLWFLHVKNSQRHLVRVVTQQDLLVAIYVNGVSTHVNSEDFSYCCLSSDVPNIYSLVPSSTEEHISIIRVPLQTINSISMCPNVPLIQISWISLWQRSKFQLSLISSKHIILTISADFTGEQDLIILKFFEKKVLFC